MVQQFLVLSPDCSYMRSRLWFRCFNCLVIWVSFPSLCEGARAAFEPLGRWVSKVHVQFCLQVTRTNAVISAWKCALPEGWDGWDSKESNHREADHRRARCKWCFLKSGPQTWQEFWSGSDWISFEIDFTFWRFSSFKSMGYDVCYSLHSIHLWWGHTGWGSMNSSMKFGNGRCSPRCLWTSQTRSLDFLSGHIPTSYHLLIPCNFLCFHCFHPFSNVLYDPIMAGSQDLNRRVLFRPLFSRWQVLALPSCWIPSYITVRPFVDFLDAFWMLLKCFEVAMTLSFHVVVACCGIL